MQFSRHLRPRIADGEITITIRVWQRPRVHSGGRYRMGGGWVQVTAVREIALAEVTDALAQQSGFRDGADLFATARHGSGENIYLVEFFYQND